MNIDNAADLAKVVAAGYAFVTYVHYTSADHEARGNIISRHRTYEAAMKAAKGNTFAGILQVAR